MAIDYSGYAQAYGGGGGGAGGAGMLGQGISSMINARKAQKALNVTQSYQDILSQDFMSGNVLEMMSKDAKDWSKDLGGAGITDAFSSYNAWKDSIKGTPQEKIALRQGLINPIAWKQQHDAYMSMVAPTIADKILNYQREGNKGSDEMRKFISDRGLGSFITTNFKDLSVPGADDLNKWATPKVGLGEQFKDIARGWTTDWTPGGALGTGTALGGGIVYGGYKAAKAGKFAADKWKSPGMGGRKGLIFGSKKTVRRVGKELMPTGGQASQDILDRARSQYKSMHKTQGGPGVGSKQGKSLKQTIKNLETRVAREIKRPTNVKDAKVLWKRLTTQYGGKSGVIKALWKKAGPKKALGIISRLGLGVVGTAVPEAVSTVAGIGLTGYTLYSLGQLLLIE